MTLHQPETQPRILVAGAGINGLMAAFYLVKEGADVTICDAGPIPNTASASFGPHRLLHPWHSSGDARNATAALRALSLWKSVLHEIGCTGFVRTGVLVAGPIPPCRKLECGEAYSSEAAEAALTGAGSAAHIMMFPQFGVLLADLILRCMTDWLSVQLVKLMPSNPLRDYETASGRAKFANGEKEIFDRIVIAVGSGLTDLSDHQGFGTAQARRSYVLNLPETHMPRHHRPRVAWACLSGTDLWGMPALPGLRAKFGCGLLTHSAEQPELLDRVVIDAMIAAYEHISPAYRFLSRAQATSGIWTWLPVNGLIRRSGTVIFVMNDRGEGFKFAPLAGKAVANEVTSRLDTSDQNLEISLF